MSPAERRKKTAIWTALNREYLEEQEKRKREIEAGERPKRRPRKKPVQQPKFRDQEEAIGFMMATKGRKSAKINYDALKIAIGGDAGAAGGAAAGAAAAASGD